MRSSWSRRRTLFATGGIGAAVAVGVVALVMLAGLPFRQSSVQAPIPPPAITVFNNSGNLSFVINTHPAVCNVKSVYQNVTSDIVLNDSGVTSGFSLRMMAVAAGDYGNASFGFELYVSGVLSPPLAPTSVLVLFNNLGNASVPAVPIINGTVFMPGGTPVNVSNHPWFVTSDWLQGNGTIYDYAVLTNDSGNRPRNFEFYVPLNVYVAGLSIPLNSTAVNTFHVIAFLNGLGTTVRCMITVNITDIYTNSPPDWASC